MKRLYIAIIAILMLPTLVLADETVPTPAPGARVESTLPSDYSLDPKKDQFTRKAVVLGLSLGGGYQNVLTQNLYRNTATYTANLRVGAGITEHILVMLSPSINYSRIDSSNFYAFMIPVSGQFFVFRDFYLRPGVGIGISNKTFNGFNRITNIVSKVSIAADVALGYEFRLNKYLAIGPELYYRYMRLPNGSFATQLNMVGAQVSLTSYIKY
ncbi:MAG: hypothetical protein COV45_04990 [Deltaproteobacteria bacterium CG11_big_fil_rev_8_21_14_0_20_47_16]|nr:MAG: hypothetical protein COV45_04990 [Deltaproteobacteria bacterium CG11_big_fil_rev_8_21_14_0_20_47_16]